MKAKEVRKVGKSFTFAELIMKTATMGQVFRRDAEELSKFGIKLEVLTAFDEKSNELQTLPSDLEMQTLKMCATDAKNKLGEELREEIKRFVFIAKQVYGADNQKLYLYTIIAPSKLTDSSLSHQAWVVANITKNNIADFGEFNITDDDCSALIAMQEDFKMKFIEIDSKIKARDNATELRWTKANEIYKEMIRICEVGKFVWESVSEARYNDYVLYPNSGSSKVESTVSDDEDNYEGVPEFDYNS